MLKHVAHTLDPWEALVESAARTPCSVPELWNVFQRLCYFAKPLQCYRQEVNVSLMEVIGTEGVEDLILRTWACDPIVLE